MRKGNITRRGGRSFRIKIELERDPATGKRRHHLETVSPLPGEMVSDTKKRAKRRQIEILHELDEGQYVTRANMTVERYIAGWLRTETELAAKTLHRYNQLATQQIYVHLGAIELQKLGKADHQAWHATLRTCGGKDGRPLSAQTLKHAHRVLGRALARAVEGELIKRNVASSVRPPKVPKAKIASLRADETAKLLDYLGGTRMHLPAILALGLGLRRGEVLGLQWGDINLEVRRLQIARSLGQAGREVFFKDPKSEAGRRAMSIPPSVAEALRQHRVVQMEQRLQLRLGRLSDADLLFTDAKGRPLIPDNFSRDWKDLMIKGGFEISFHGLRHSHASALIDGGLDVRTVASRIGHHSAALTLTVYAHKFQQRDAECDAAIEAAFGTKRVPNA
jgi:integrase